MTHRIHDTQLLTIPSTEIQLGDTLLAIENIAQPYPRVVLSKDLESHWGAELMAVQLDGCITQNVLCSDGTVMVRRPVTERGTKAVIDQLLLRWRDAHFAAEFGGVDYTVSRACKKMSFAIWQLENPNSTDAYEEDDYIADLLERAYEGTDERYFMPPC